MSNVSINTDCLKSTRKKFRKNIQVEGGKKQKLAHIDNLMSIALGYTGGYGNFSAMISKSTYLFSMSNVDPMLLAQYEINNISCASGLENYICLYRELGLSAIEINSFCKSYLLHKLTYSTWHTLTHPSCAQEQFYTLLKLVENDSVELNSQVSFTYTPLCGLYSSNLFFLNGLDDLGLTDKRPMIEGIIKLANEDKRETDLYGNDSEIRQYPKLAEVMKELDFKLVSKLVLEHLISSCQSERIFDTRAYVHYLLNCDSENCVEFSGGLEMHLGDGCLILKDVDFNFDSVLLTEPEEMELETSLDCHEKGELTQKLFSKRWLKNKKQGSSTLRSERQDWRHSIENVSRSLDAGKHIPSNILFNEVISAVSEDIQV